MNRRSALKNISLSFGVLAITPGVIGLMQSCATATKETFVPKFFKVIHLDDLYTILDLILPPSDDGVPGASQLNLLEFIDKYLCGVISDKKLTLLDQSITSLMYYTHNQNFSELSTSVSSENWKVQLNKYLLPETNQEEAWKKALKKPQIERKKMETDGFSDAYNFFALQSLRDFAVFAFKSSRVIGEEYLYYAPIPGKQQGCISLEEATQGKLHAAI